MRLDALRHTIQQGDRICRDTETLERELLGQLLSTQSDVGDSTDPAEQSMQWDQRYCDGQQQLFEYLCDLLHPPSKQRDRISMLVTGENMEFCGQLVHSFQRWAKHAGVNCDGFAVLQQDRANERPRVIEDARWNARPTYTVPTVSERREETELEASRASESHDVADSAPPTTKRTVFHSLAAFAPLRAPDLSNGPKGTVGWILNFKGPSASLILSGEHGVHSFLASPSNTFACSVNTEILRDEISVPDCMARGGFVAIGEPRRNYNQVDSTIIDFIDEDTPGATGEYKYDCTIDKFTAWLVPSLERHLQKRVWEQLDPIPDPHSIHSPP
ncbi:MAG: hypothetical protein AAFP90_17210 [Planctomycetota bacterium]